jgi:hypothetical protein
VASPKRRDGVASGMAGIALLAAAIAPYSLGLNLTSPDPRAMHVTSALAYLYSVAPLVSVVASIALTIALSVIAAGRHAFPMTWLFGGALVVHATGLLVLAAATGGSVPIFVLGAAIVGLTEPAVSAVGVAYAALVAPPRGATLVVGAWFFVTGAIGQVGWALQALDARAALLAVFAALCLVAGATVVATGRAFHRAFFEPNASSSATRTAHAER